MDSSRMRASNGQIMLILATSSLRRMEIMKRAGFEFKSIRPLVDETWNKKEKAEKFVERLATEKAIDAEKRINFVRGTDIFIGVDTVGVFKGKIMGKPQNDDEARKMLKLLSGKVHIVLTGVAMKKGDVIKTFTEKTKVKFKALTPKEIDAYVRTGEPLGKASAYAIQGRAALFVERVEGDFLNVVGLPVFRLWKELQKMGVEKV